MIYYLIHLAFSFSDTCGWCWTGFEMLEMHFKKLMKRFIPLAQRLRPDGGWLSDLLRGSSVQSSTFCTVAAVQRTPVRTQTPAMMVIGPRVSWTDTSTDLNMKTRAVIVISVWLRLTQALVDVNNIEIPDEKLDETETETAGNDILYFLSPRSPKRKVLIYLLWIKLCTISHSGVYLNMYIECDGEIVPTNNWELSSLNLQLKWINERSAHNCRNGKSWFALKHKTLEKNIRDHGPLPLG